MLNFKQILTMHCREASRLASDEMDRALTLSERIGMWAHLAICVGCRRMRMQVRLVQRWAEHLCSADSPLSDQQTARLSTARRRQIKQALRQCES